MAILNWIRIRALFTVLPPIHAKNYHCILLVTESNNVMRTLRQAKLGNWPLWVKILGQNSCKHKAKLDPGPQKR